MKKRWIAMGLVSAMLVTGCGAQKAEDGLREGTPEKGTAADSTGTTSKPTSDAKESESTGSSTISSGSASESAGGMSGEFAEGTGSAIAKDSYGMSDMDMSVSEDSFWEGGSIATEETAGADGWYDDAVIGEIEAGEMEVPAEGWVDIQPAAGLLTAGEWCDNENWEFFANLIATERFNFQVFGLMPYQRVAVQAVSNGVAVKQAQVVLLDAQGATIATAVTNQDGMAYLYYNTAEGEAAEPMTVAVQTGALITADLSTAETKIVTVQPKEEQQEPNQENPQEQEIYYGDWYIEQVMNPGITAVISHELTVEVPDYTAPVKKLDLMFVFDTTGSMGDELRYLQREFEDIAEKVADQSTRISVNFYRDEGDEYIVNAYPFMQDIKEVGALINRESANGGGDYEEAVDLALKDAVFGHSWEADSVKLMFLILDAPPHDTAEVRANLEEVVEEAARQGIRIIPIASSGVDATSEAFLRNLAMMTGGTYTFLTNDSGIGGSHLEPTIGEYEVEALNDLIVRLVQEYYQ
ncbi:MAG: VWA domain-containing protein [Lachnospiraceae bacterium]|nr:VWA domain-containing protein [Lachnospiraceae bacterium]